MSFQIGNRYYDSVSDLEAAIITKHYVSNNKKECDIETQPTPVRGNTTRVTDMSVYNVSTVEKEVSFKWINKTEKGINLLSKGGLLTYLPPSVLTIQDGMRDILIYVVTYRISNANASAEYQQYIKTRSKRTFTQHEALYYEALRNIVTDGTSKSIIPVITLNFATEYNLGNLDLSEHGSYLVDADVVAFGTDKLLPLHPVGDERTASVVDSTLLNEKSAVIAIDLIDNDNVLPTQYFLYNDEVHSCKPRLHERLPSNAYVTIYTPNVNSRTRILDRDEAGKVIYDRKTYTIPLEDISKTLKLYSSQNEAKTGGNVSASFQLELEKLKQENLREQIAYQQAKQRSTIELDMLRETMDRAKHEATLKEMNMQSEINTLKHERDRYKLEVEREKYIREEEADKRKYFRTETYEAEARAYQLQRDAAEQELQQWKTYASYAAVLATVVGIGIKLYKK